MDKKPAKTNGIAFAALFLGISIIISSLILGSRISDLNKTFKDKVFYSSQAPSIINQSELDSPYFSESEAAEYLKISENDIKNMILKNEISGYIQTSAGNYVISKDALDKWFANHSSKPA